MISENKNASNKQVNGKIKEHDFWTLKKQVNCKQSESNKKIVFGKCNMQALCK